MTRRWKGGKLSGLLVSQRVPFQRQMALKERERERQRERERNTRIVVRIRALFSPITPRRVRLRKRAGRKETERSQHSRIHHHFFSLRDFIKFSTRSFQGSSEWFPVHSFTRSPR